MTANTFQSERAKSLLAHYLKFGLEANGYHWDGDNTAEVNDIVDSIIDACESTPSIPSTADPLTRIADALERIADKLDLLCAKGTDYSGADMAVLRIETLR